MDVIKRAFTISFLLLLFLFISGCVQQSSEREEIFTTYSRPDVGFVMKYPQTWSINNTTFKGGIHRVILGSPENRASIMVDTKPYHHVPEGTPPGGFGISYEVPNSTSIDSFKKIRFAGDEAIIWTFIVENPDRVYYDKMIGVTHVCPSVYNNTTTYFLHFEFDAGDAQLENAVQVILDSISVTCPSVN